MVEMDVEYLGGLRCKAVHGPSGVELVIDAPVDNHGRGESFSPTDLVAASLGACMLTLMGIAAEKDRLDLTGSKVHVEKHMVADPRRRIGKVVARVTLPAALTPPKRRKLEAAARTCPVVRSLGKDVEIAAEFAYR
jgi:putative redox protein